MGTAGRKKACAVVIAIVLLSACGGSGGDISAQLAQQYDKNEPVIDLALLGPPSWDRVCMLTPYTDNGQAEKILGFKWDAERNTRISASDAINVLVFVSGTSVVAFAEHPRSKGDFLQLNPRCLPRGQAKVVRKPGLGNERQLVAKDP